MRKSSVSQAYTLKKGQPPFEVVDGAFAGHKYQPGEKYTIVPPSEEDRFEEFTPPPRAETKKTTGKKKEIIKDA